MKEVIGNEAMRLECTCTVTINGGDNSEGLPCDISHVAGMGCYLPDEFLKRIKENIPKTDVQVKVDPGGYIIWPEHFPDNHYTLDEIGRTVCKIDGIRFFQRYTSSDFLVSDNREDYFGSMSSEEKEDILNYLNSLAVTSRIN